MIMQRSVMVTEEAAQPIMGVRRVVQLWDVRLRGHDTGLWVIGSADVELEHSSIQGNDTGIIIEGSAYAVLQGAEVEGNWGDGLVVSDAARVRLLGSRLAYNGYDGVEVGGEARVTIEESMIENNGTDDICSAVGVICAGLEVQGEAELFLIDTVIRENADWGVTAWWTACGYEEDRIGDYFIEFSWGWSDLVYDNNRTGDQNGMGNPGDHRLWALPDGQVCLPYFRGRI